MASQLLWRNHIAWSDGQTSNGLHCWLGTHIRSRACCPHAPQRQKQPQTVNLQASTRAVYAIWTVRKFPVVSPVSTVAPEFHTGNSAVILIESR